MTDLPDDDAPDPAAVAAVLPPPMTRATNAVESAVATLRTVAAATKALLAELDTYPVARATPAERTALVDLYWQLKALATPAFDRARAIEMAWSRGMAELGAKKLPLADGRMVVYEAPAASWQVDAPALKRDLAELRADGLITDADLGRAFTTTIEVKADNRVLNNLADSRGEVVAGVIAAHRTRPEPSPLAGRVKFPVPREVPRADD